MNFLLIGADRNNSTDGVIVKGIINLLDKVYKNYTYDYHFLNDHQDESFDQTKNYDIIFICGTPWLWDSFQNSVKYKNLYKCFQLHPRAKKVFMGAGTCLNTKDIHSDILKRSEEIEGINKLFKDNTIITRDSVAQERFNHAGLESTFLPCPAYYCYLDYPTSSTFEENVLIWVDPQQTISSGDWQDKSKLDNYYDVVKAFYKDYTPNVYCASLLEIDAALKIGLPPPTLLKGWNDTLNIMNRANYVLSGRVHCAVPAFVKNKAVGLLQLDSRSGVLSNFGGLLVNSQEDLTKLKFKNNDFSMYIDKYKEILGNI